MKSIMLSIQPKWCELIVNGKKTVEVRKTRPKIDVPFKCYIYCTKGSKVEQMCFGKYTCRIGNGKVIGEFVCDDITEIHYHDWSGDYGVPMDLFFANIFAESTCLNYEELDKYLQGKDGYGWNISNLVIYDEPKELGEFYQIGDNSIDYCVGCIYHETPACEFPCYTCNGNRKYLTRPFQSWGYVDKSEGKK